MKSRRKSKKIDVAIEDLYAIKIRSIWQQVKQEHISFWALVIYFFFDYVRPQSIYPVIDILPWAQVTLIIALFGVFVDRSVSWVANIENRLLIFFIIIIILSSIFAFDPIASWSHKYFMLNWLILYFLVINILNTKMRLFIFLLGYLLFSFKMSQHGFFSWAGRGFSFTQWGLIGPSGWFNNSSDFAIQMLIFGSLSTAFILGLKERWGRWKRWFFYFMPFTAFLTVLGASSRGAQLALLVMGVVLLLKSRSGFKAFIFLVLAGLFFYFLLPDEQIQRFANIGQDNNSITRLAYWDFGMEVVRDHPILGVGYNNWLSYAWFSMPDGIIQGRTQLPHNIFIRAAAELGLVGLFCFLLLVISVFVTNARTRKLALRFDDKLMYCLSYGLDYGLIGYLAAGFFVSVLYYPFFWVQMAMVVALNNVMVKTSILEHESGIDVDNRFGAKSEPD